MLISQGTFRYVYDIGNGFIKKIPINKHGIWQNEFDICMHNNNIDNDLILPFIDYDKNSEWVIQKSITHFLKIIYLRRLI